jgi:uncharacterized membrane protein
MRDLWTDLRSSFWFVPAVIVCAAVTLALALIETDRMLAQSVMDSWPRLFGAGAAGSRGMLSTIAGSMITVAGVVFSITIVSLSLASSQYSSRVLRNFMRDRANQTVLGVFVGIFAYCLVALRTIRGGDEGAFVPALSVLVAVALAFVGIAFLIFFIDHIGSSIQASQIIATVAKETLEAVDHLFPEDRGEPADESDGPAEMWDITGPRIRRERVGPGDRRCETVSPTSRPRDGPAAARSDLASGCPGTDRTARSSR